jgi:hypothetical protein
LLLQRRITAQNPLSGYRCDWLQALQRKDDLMKGVLMHPAITVHEPQQELRFILTLKRSLHPRLSDTAFSYSHV